MLQTFAIQKVTDLKLVESSLQEVHYSSVLYGTCTSQYQIELYVFSTTAQYRYSKLHHSTCCVFYCLDDHVSLTLLGGV